MGRMGVPGVWPPLRCHVLQATLGPLSWVRDTAVCTVGPVWVPVVCPAPPCAGDFTLQCPGPGGRQLPSPRPVRSLSHWVPPPGTF